MAISISYSNVEAGVKAISSKVALKGEGTMERAAILEDDSTLEKYYLAAMNMLYGIYGKFCSQVTKTGSGTSTSYSFTLTMPGNWDSDQTRVGYLSLDYAINYVCACWFEAVKPELEDRYKRLYETQGDTIVKELIIRKRPTRT